MSSSSLKENLSRLSPILSLSQAALSFSMEAIRMEAQDLFNRSSQEVKDLTHKFFKSMDTNDDDRVNLQEIQSFFRDGNFRIQPYSLHGLLMELDQDHDYALNFTEFITFFYLVFLRAKCHHCGKWLMGKKRRTCVDCFNSATAFSCGTSTTYDICRTCFHITHRYSHHQHSRSKLLNYEDVIFNNGNVPGLSGTTTSSGMMEPRQEIFRRLFIALHTVGACATIATAAVAFCSIM